MSNSYPRNKLETTAVRFSWTAHDVLAGIKALHEAGASLSCKDLQWNRDEVVSNILLNAIGVKTTGAKLYSAASRLFGSSAKAVTAAGLDPKIFRHVPRFWTKKLILTCIRNLHAEGIPLNVAEVTGNKCQRVEEILLATTEVNTSGKALYNATLKRFGSWDQALTDAELVPADIRRIGFLTPDVILRTIRALDGANICPSYSEMQRGSETTTKVIRSVTGRRSTGVSIVLTAKKHFGSWDGALKAAGIDPARVRKDRFWTKELIAKCLRVLSDAQVPLHARAINLDMSSDTTALLRPVIGRECTGSSLFQAARFHFDSWDEALSAAELNPIAIKRKGFWTRDSIRKSIIALNDKNIPLNAGKMSRNQEEGVSRAIESAIGKFSTGEGLHRAGRDVFGSWDNAIKESGLEPKRIRVYRPRWRRTTLTRIIRELHSAKVALNAKALLAERNEIRSEILRSLSGQEMNGGHIYRLGRKRFGSWDDALRGADLDPCQIRRRAIGLERQIEAVTSIIKLVHEGGIRLNRGSVTSKSKDIGWLTCKKLNRVISGYSLVNAAISVAGSWDEALEAAQFDPYKIRLRFPATSNLPIIPHQVERVLMPDGKVRRVTYLGHAPKMGDEILEERHLALTIQEAILELSPDDQIIVAETFDLLLQDDISLEPDKLIQSIALQSNGEISEERISRIFSALRGNASMAELGKGLN